LKTLRLLALPVLLPLLPACGLGPVECDTSVAHSVTISVVDEAGGRVGDARVSFSHAGGAEQQAACIQPAPDGRSCGQWGAGSEQAGAFTVRATSADGTRRAEGQVSVEEGRCHVQSQTLTLTLR
jgi:hypothetical protein